MSRTSASVLSDGSALSTGALSLGSAEGAVEGSVTFSVGSVCALGVSRHFIFKKPGLRIKPDFFLFENVK